MLKKGDLIATTITCTGSPRVRKYEKQNLFTYGENYTQHQKGEIGIYLYKCGCYYVVYFFKTKVIRGVYEDEICNL